MEYQLRLSGDWPDARRRAPALAGDDLETVLFRLQEAEINAWISTTPPAHIAVGVHDPNGGEDIRRDFEASGGQWPRGEIARWLLETVRWHYPGQVAP